jgi:hypothetical protein
METSNSTVKATSSSGYYYSDFAATTNPARVYRVKLLFLLIRE